MFNVVYNLKDINTFVCSTFSIASYQINTRLVFYYFVGQYACNIISLAYVVPI